MSGMHPDVFISLFVSFLAIAAYNALELLIWIFNFFRRRRGLYFWSILTGTVSVAGFMVITTISYFVKTPTAASATGVAVALVYPCLLTAQILVLYSRLHLITPTQGPLLLVVRWGIIISSVLLLIPFTVNLTGLSTTTSKTQQRFLAAERVIEHYTIIGTLSRELLICAIYLFQALRQLKPILAVKGAAGRRVIIHLILAMGAVIVLDAFMLLTTFGGASGLGLAYSCVAHSIKLKVEFGILNRLLELLGAPSDGHSGELGLNELHDSSSTAYYQETQTQMQTPQRSRDEEEGLGYARYLDMPTPLPARTEYRHSLN